MKVNKLLYRLVPSNNISYVYANILYGGGEGVVLHWEVGMVDLQKNFRRPFLMPMAKVNKKVVEL